MLIEDEIQMKGFEEPLLLLTSNDGYDKLKI